MDPRKIDAALAILAAGIPPDSVRRLLVVGCGNGEEVCLLARRLPRCELTGVDLKPCSLPSEDPADRVCLLQMDAQDLSFDDASFDAIYSYHFLEHVTDPDQALSEMRRVLKPEGVCYLGFPNRNRLVAYLNTTEPLRMRLWWNLNDWRLRLLGRFRNELGAHAGFSQRESRALLGRHFSRIQPVREDYYAHMYPRLATAFEVLRRLGLTEYLYVSNLYLCRP